MPRDLLKKTASEATVERAQESFEWVKHLVKPSLVELTIPHRKREDINLYEYILLDCNESAAIPYHTDPALTLNRYTLEQPLLLRDTLADLYGVHSEKLLVTRGSIEGIDACIRTFCTPFRDIILMNVPGWDYYPFIAGLNMIDIRKIPMITGFKPDIPSILSFQHQQSVEKNLKLIMFVSPNNPTGTIVDLDDISRVCKAYYQKAIIVVDETYNDFACAGTSAISLLDSCTNLIVLRSLSKAFSCANIRIGSIIAHGPLIEQLLKIIPPFAFSRACTEIALQVLTPAGLSYAHNHIEEVRAERSFLQKELKKIACVSHVYETQTNFVLITVYDSAMVYKALFDHSIIIRACPEVDAHCLRITIGSAQQNRQLLSVLASL